MVILSIGGSGGNGGAWYVVMIRGEGGGVMVMGGVTFFNHSTYE